MGIINQNTGLFNQQFKIGIVDSNYKMEKVTLGPITKGTIEITVDKGSKAIINGEFYEGRNEVHKFSLNDLGIKKGEKINVILIPNQMIDTIEFGLYAGRFKFQFEELKTVKLEYAVVVYVNFEVTNHKTLVQYFNDTYTDEDLTEAINAKIIDTLAGTCAVIMSRYESKGVIPAEIIDEKDKIYMELKRTTLNALNQFGVTLTGIFKLQFNPTDETKKIINDIVNKINDNAIDSLDENERKRQEEELEKQRQHEINLEKARNSKIIEKTEIISKNINESGVKEKKHFCSQCGKEIEKADALFCSYCGAKL